MSNERRLISPEKLRQYEKAFGAVKGEYVREIEKAQEAMKRMIVAGLEAAMRDAKEQDGTCRSR